TEQVPRVAVDAVEGRHQQDLNPQFGPGPERDGGRLLVSAHGPRLRPGAVRETRIGAGAWAGRRSPSPCVAAQWPEQLGRHVGVRADVVGAELAALPLTFDVVEDGEGAVGLRDGDDSGGEGAGT